MRSGWAGGPGISLSMLTSIAYEKLIEELVSCLYLTLLEPAVRESFNLLGPLLSTGLAVLTLYYT